MLCYCNSQLKYSECCQPFIEGKLNPTQPLQLMRSRFSAYTIKNAQYIVDTYAPEYRHLHPVADISEWAKQCDWLALTIHYASNVTTETFVSPEDSLVCFSAFYRQNHCYYQLKEESRFLLQDNLWFYLDGEIVLHEEIKPPKRNDLCFCLSNKKFKKCCGK